MKILLNTKAQVIAGDNAKGDDFYSNWNVIFEKSGGGYQMFLNHPTDKIGFDHWFLTEEEMNKFLKKKKF